MARIRTIKPEFFTSADIVSLTPLARLFYISLWCESDREGRLDWKPKTFKLRYFPGDDCDIESMAKELVNVGLIIIYEIDGVDYAEIPSFSKHQVINNRESDSERPERVNDASCTRESGDKAEGKEGRKGREGKGKEVRGSVSPEITFEQFLEDCKAKNELPIPKDDPVFKWAQSVNLPDSIMFVGWHAFKKREWLDSKRKPKKYKDWRAVFMNYCKNPEWLNVWNINRDGEYFLTAKGKQLEAEIKSETT